jgi:hypothetical protein
MAEDSAAIYLRLQQLLCTGMPVTYYVLLLMLHVPLYLHWLHDCMHAVARHYLLPLEPPAASPAVAHTVACSGLYIAWFLIPFA